MVEQTVIEHHIQKHIIGVLTTQKWARFRDLRPKGVDTNLFSYHLKSLIKLGYVTKTAEGYTLSSMGLVYVDRFSLKNLNVRSQPKIITMAVLTSGDRVLLQRRDKQPFIDAWSFPYGKTHMDDPSVLGAVQREVKEKLGTKDCALNHAGDCYIHVRMGEGLVSTMLAHVFTGTCPDTTLPEDARWVHPAEFLSLRLAPAVETIYCAVLERRGHFFIEIYEDWYT